MIYLKKLKKIKKNLTIQNQFKDFFNSIKKEFIKGLKCNDILENTLKKNRRENKFR